METLFIPNENDFKRWIREAVKECLEGSLPKEISGIQKQETFLSRKVVAQRLEISLVTLTDWVKRGLPSHKQRGRVYFIFPEVIEYIKENKMKQLKFGKRFQELSKEIA